MKRLYRDRWDKKIGGVCGGIGRYLSIDPTFIRLIYAFCCLITGVIPLLVTYILLWMLMPLGSQNYIQFSSLKFYRSKKEKKIAGICSGVAETFQIDPTIVRVVLILLMILTGFFPLMLIYILGMFIIPLKPEE